jgi:uncharacterized protein (DUF1501 family)
MFITRRRFLKTSLGGAGLLTAVPYVPAFLLTTSLGQATKDAHHDRVLVVVQLSGGNDGLNTLVPYGDDAYAQNRPTVRLPAEQLHKIDAQFGFHPRMAAFSRLYKEGLLGVVQGVGCADLSRDHDAAMRTWHSASPGQADCPTGWLGKTADTIWDLHEAQSKVAFVGPIKQPFAMNAARVVVPSIRSPKDLTLHAMQGQPAGVPRQARPSGGDPLLALVQDSMERSYSNSRKIQAVVDSAAGQAEYPAFGFAGDLRTVAQLIRAEIGIQVFFTELGGDGFGGFDNHANQLGNHCALLHQMSESISAFANDLSRDGLLDNVLLLTFSEFGRTVKENGRRGTDHGNAAPVFLAGGRLKGGLVGLHPSLTDLDNGALAPHTDFRRVYATVLDRWLGFDSKVILGGPFEALEVLDV